MAINSPTHLKYVATLPCNLSLITCFLTLMFHMVVWQHVQGVVGFLIITLLQFTNLPVKKNFETRLRFERVMAVSLSSWYRFWA